MAIGGLRLSRLLTVECEANIDGQFVPEKQNHLLLNSHPHSTRTGFIMDETNFTAATFTVNSDILK